MQTQTPPELKWLLVERATLAGDIARLEKSREHLAQEISKHQARVDALDTTMRLLESKLNVRAAGSIRRHTVEYGQRGALRAFVIETLKAASPGATDTKAVVHGAIAHFGLVFSSRADFTSFAKNSVKRELLRLKEKGLVEALHPTGGRSTVGIWRWKKGDLPTIAELAGLA